MNKNVSTSLKKKTNYTLHKSEIFCLRRERNESRAIYALRNAHGTKWPLKTGCLVV